jgi:hypothetical protein
MKDYEKLISLFKGFGIESKLDSDNKVYLEAKSQEKIEGYNGFCVVFEFDDDGKFKKLGIWE